MADSDPLPVPESWDERPWGRPGSPPRDCPPHRGHWLLLLASVTLACGILSFLCLPGLLGLPLGFVTAGMARRDLDQMDAGSLDPRGRESTSKALRQAEVGTLINILGLVALALFLAWRWIVGWVIFNAVG
jgi:hypothetical protein